MSNNRRRERRPRRSDRCGVPAPCPQNLTASPHHIHGTSCQLPHHCEEPSGDVAISCGNVAFCTAVPGDSQKVNCPGGAREATLGYGLRPRNDMLDGSWSNRLQQRPTRGVGNAVPGVPTGAVRKHRARKILPDHRTTSAAPPTSYHCHCEVETVAPDVRASDKVVSEGLPKTAFPLIGFSVGKPSSLSLSYTTGLIAMNASPLGVDLPTIQSIVGHADIDMTQHYLHVQEPVRNAAVEKFAEAFKRTTE